VKNAATNKNENLVTESDVIISRTDTKGIITYVSPDFARISEYSTEEMIGKAHNIVRHPDMPKSVFKELWEFIRIGLPWTGAVKNKSKSGNYYWVDATVTPIMGNDGKITGYVSVRKKLSDDQKLYYEKQYQAIGNQSSFRKRGRTVVKNIGIVKPKEVGLIVFISIPFFLFMISNFREKPLFFSVMILIQIVVGVFSLCFLSLKNKKLQTAAESAVFLSAGMLRFNERIQNDSTDEIKIMLLSMKSMSINLWGIVSQIQKATHSSVTISKELTDLTNYFSESVHAMASGSEEAASCMEELNSALENIKYITFHHSVAMKEIKDYMNSMNLNLNGTMNHFKSLDRLSVRAEETANEGKRKIIDSLKGIDAVKKVSEKVLNIVTIINEISDRSNLLSLNASIEAARAGKSGAGFAVVAKEMMNLNERIGNSTNQIQDYVNETLSAVNDASVKVKDASSEVHSLFDLFNEMKMILNNVTESLKEDINEAALVKHKLDAAESQVEQIDSSTSESNLASKQISSVLMELSEQTQLIAAKSDLLLQTSSVVVSEPKKILELVGHYETGMV